MNPVLARRSFANTVITLAFGGALFVRPGSSAEANNTVSGENITRAIAALATLEYRSGGRLGVSALEIGSGLKIGFRGAERFPMCSTHKFLTAAAMLARVDRGEVRLEQRIHYGQKDILDYAPITNKYLASGSMSIDALCEASIEWSDNTAENLVLELIGGVNGWTHYARSIGDTISRLDRTEPTSNEALPGDPRDTTSPEAIVSDLKRLFFEKSLTNISRARLMSWMLNNKITMNLLSSTLPHNWRIGDKSGSGGHGTRNDIGIILRPSARPILIAVYYTGAPGKPSARDAVIAETGRIIFGAFKG